MIEDMSDVVRELATGTYTVRRRSSGSYVGGRWVPDGPAEEFTSQGAVLPAGGQTMDHWAEGDYSKDIRSFLSLVPLQTGDVVVVDETDFEVLSVEPWNDVGNFCKAVIHARDVG